MKNSRSLIIIILCVSLIGCTSLGLTPTPTSTPTAAATAIPTHTPTPTITPLPSATPTLVEIGEDGLPIFPENSTSRGNGLEIAFSQGILNRLGVKSVTISNDKVLDIKTVLVGAWIYMMGGPAFGNVDPMKLDDLRDALQKTSGLNIILGDQKIRIDSETLIRFEFLLLCSEQKSLIDYYSKQPGSTFRVRPYWTTPPIMFLHVTENSLNFIYSMDCLEAEYLTKHHLSLEPKIAWMLGNAFSASSTSFYDVCIRKSPVKQRFSGCWSQKRAPIEYDIYAMHLVNFWDSSDEIASTILGGCKWENRECVSGSEVWKFIVTP
ncbi:MAG TPA: hypothetical protein PLA27_04275 [Anaerolineales bacterium]|jgi:hypothetical protein|nr:hypothetical protein [Anaerolineales bacterium]HQX15614.1 hypothetical protein [Anaerolineales bacterium]